MLRKSIYTTGVCLALLAGGVQADTLLIDNVAAERASATPARGAQKARIAESYGEPVSRQDAVGDPPISSWEYDDFIVYFEYDRVLHTVAKR